MNLSDITLRVSVLKVLADEVSERLKEAKDDAEAAFRATGTTQAKPALPDGTQVATATLAGGGGKSASITSEAAFIAWVAKNHPGEIVQSVRDNYRKKILDAAKAAGKPIDPATGEMVPGITVGPSSPYVSLRFKAGGKEAVVEAWRAGELKGIELVPPAAIEGGEAA